MPRNLRVYTESVNDSKKLQIKFEIWRTFGGEPHRLE